MAKPRVQKLTLDSVEVEDTYVSYDGQSAKITLVEYAGGYVKKRVVLNVCPYVVDVLSEVAGGMVRNQQRQVDDMRGALLAASQAEPND